MHSGTLKTVEIFGKALEFMNTLRRVEYGETGGGD